MHPLDMLIKYWAYMAHMPNSVDIFVSDTYLAVTGKVKVAVACVFGYAYKNVSLHAHVACCLCELYLECGSYIYSVISIKYVYTAPC